MPHLPKETSLRLLIMKTLTASHSYRVTCTLVIMKVLEQSTCGSL
jgi:hypothetical protein